MRRRPLVLIPAALVVTLALAVGLLLFQPWKLFVDQRVDESLPQATAPPTPAPGAGTPDAGTPATNLELAIGTFVGHEHPTTGRVRVLTLADGSRVLRLEDLDTTNGPDLRVWLTDQPVRTGRDGWFVFDDGAYVDLGRLKGNQGSQNYVLPADVDLAAYRSVSVWCARFRVSFGAAALSPPGTGT